MKSFRFSSVKKFTDVFIEKALLFRPATGSNGSRSHMHAVNYKHGEASERYLVLAVLMPKVRIRIVVEVLKYLTCPLLRFEQRIYI